MLTNDGKDWDPVALPPLPKKNLWINDTREPILISYLGAVSSLPDDIYKLMDDQAKHDSKIPSTYRDDCFRNDFAGKKFK
jgi:hypothetical protein